uniref:C2 domain-containing protein n=1 Tax=Acrobeloides nanus TaxID=290746 RepID=A0A914ECL1_9BILA
MFTTQHDDTLLLRFSCVSLTAECTQGVRISVNALVEQGYHSFIEIGQTETVRNRISPNFSRLIPIIFRIDLNQLLKFVIYLVDGSSETIIGKFGEAELPLFNILSSNGQMSIPILSDSLKPGWSLNSAPLLNVSIDAPETSRNGTILQFHGSNLNPNNGFLTAPYFTLSLLPNDERETKASLLYRSEIVHNTDSPKWQEFLIPTKFLSSSSESALEISCYNYNTNSEDTLTGKFTTTLFQLLRGAGSINRYLLHCAARKKKEEMSIELVKIDSQSNVPSFVDFLNSGTQLHFTFAIDFTANNGSPNDPHSLHFIHPHQSNVYMRALHSISLSVEKFDKLSRLSLLGFGAKTPPDFEMSQCFALNGDLNNPYIRGFSEAVDLYKRASMSVLQYAPTEYSNVINYVAKHAKASVRAFKAGFYFVLVILTNGYIKDTRDSIDQIVKASSLPMSIVFVCLGNQKHPIGGGSASNINKLLRPTLKTENLTLQRETVTIVESGYGEESELPTKVLANIPRQLNLWAIKENMNPSAQVPPP